jgi:hypothetical protein
VKENKFNPMLGLGDYSKPKDYSKPITSVNKHNPFVDKLNELNKQNYV